MSKNKILKLKKMKKLMTIFGAMLIASFMLTSCSQNPTEIKISDLKTACDYLHAAEKCMDALIELKGEVKDFDELPENKQKYAEQVYEKMEEILEAAEKKYTEKEGMECKSFERIASKAEALDL